jgi:hypothetical protein
VNGWVEAGQTGTAALLPMQRSRGRGGEVEDYQCDHWFEGGFVKYRKKALDFKYIITYNNNC